MRKTAETTLNVYNKSVKDVEEEEEEELDIQTAGLGFHLRSRRFQKF